MKSVKRGIDRYSTFGLRDEWLPCIFLWEKEWTERNNLGPIQVNAVESWLEDAGLIVRKSVTPLFRRIRDIYFMEPESAWQIIWIELYHGSPAVRIFCDRVGFDECLGKDEIIAILKSEEPDLTESTLKNPVSAIINMFDHSHLGKLITFRGNKRGRQIKRVQINHIDPHVVAYCLYRLSEELETGKIKINDLLNGEVPGCPLRLFGLEEEPLKRLLEEIENYGLVNIAEGVIYLKKTPSTEVLDTYITFLKTFNTDRPDLNLDEVKLRDKLRDSLMENPERLFGERIHDIYGFIRGASLRKLITVCTVADRGLTSEKFKGSGSSITVIILLKIAEKDFKINLNEFRDVIVICPDAALSGEMFELLLDHMTLAETRDGGEHRRIAERIISTWIGDMMQSGFRWYLNGESGGGNRLYGVSDLINTELSKRIFPFGPENIPGIRGNRNLWKTGKEYPTVFKIFFLSRTLDEFRGKSTKGLFRFLSYLLLDTNGKWIVDEDLNLKTNTDHPFKTMVEVTVDKLSKKENVDLVKELRFLSEPPYGLKGDMIGHAIVSFILRTLKGYLLINGKVVSDDELQKFKKKIIDAWDSS
ncbi:DUF4007 family protein [Methanothermobacter sp. THM-2]|uniref:DUF4007 family protein n=1 Tax=Methanothermobacter sp. THM-2 TaxID=2606912 RepID=UPI0013660390|nr:DUF4007 family protein [Methanothermobacter sp. THM-2]QHN08071.1 hypothetical protein FZP68_04575 [Methanothermobacter sp. THM-2]